MSKDSKSFDQSLQDLEDIVEWFESEDVDIDNAISKFEEGLKLSGDLKKRLEDAENKIENLRQTFDKEVIDSGDEKSSDKE